MPYMESVSIGVWINAGTRNEDKNINGISHFLEHLVFKGTKKRCAEQIKQEIEGKGGSFNGFTAEEFTCYLVKVLAKDTELGMDVLSDMVLHPLLKANDIAKEKQVIVEEINMYKDMPSHYIHELLTAALWPDHPLGFPLAGTVESVLSIDARTLARYKDTYYCPSNIVVAAVGNVKDELILKLAKRYFSKGEKRLSPAMLDASKAQEKPELVLEYKKTEQTHVAIGIHAFSRFHRDRYVLSLLNVILGANMSSRLFQKVRDQMALCYEIGSTVRRYKDAGAFVVSAGVDYEKVVKALDVIFKELHKVKRSGVGKDELKRAQEYYKGQLLLTLEDTMSSMLWFGEKVVTLEEDFSVTSILAKIDAVTADDLTRVADTVFRDENLNLAIIGPIKEKKRLEEVLHIR